MSCFSCGAAFTGSGLDRVRRYKKLYDEKGVESYFFKLSATGEVKIVRKSGFNAVFESMIKPNFGKGAEYNHIREFTG